MTEQPRIAIIGKGNVGTHLQQGFKGAGYTVEVTGSDPEHVAQVAQRADILVLAVPPDQLEKAVEECQGHHEGKVLVDASNVTDEKGDFAGNFIESRAEALQRRVPESKVVKAFNTVFADNMETGQVNGESLSLFVAGDDEAARESIEQLGRDIGFDAVDAGPLENARYLEALGYLNMKLGTDQGMGTDIGFRLVHH